MTLPGGDRSEENLERLATSAENVERTVAQRFKVSKDAIRWAFRLAVIGIAIGCTGIGVGIWGRLDAHHAAQHALEAKRAFAAYKVATNEQRANSCKQSNRQELQQASHERTEWHHALSLFAAAAPASANRAEITRAVAKFNKSQDATITGAHTLRDCTPEGIRRYLAGIPTPTTKGKP